MRRRFLQLLVICAAAWQLLAGSAAAAAGAKTTITPSSETAALTGGSGGGILSHLPPPNSAAISATSTLSGSIMSGSLVGTASTTTSSNSSAGSSPQQLLPLVLQYNDTNVPYNRDSLNTGSFKPYYYVASTLIAGWRTYLLQVGRGMGRKASSGPATFNVARAIFHPPPSPPPAPCLLPLQSAANTSLCLTFSNITSGMNNSFGGVLGLPLSFQPCSYTQSGQPRWNSQVRDGEGGAKVEQPGPHL